MIRDGLKIAILFVLLFLILLGMGSLFQGCFTPTSDIITPDHPTSEASSPLVEAYIEYPGPHEKWAGPFSFVIHVTIRGPGKPQIMISPEILKPQATEKKTESVGSQGLSTEAVREELARLNAAMQEPERVFHGCLYPVRVSLIRADGVLIERQGCRGQLGWPRIASEISNHLIESLR